MGKYEAMTDDDFKRVLDQVVNEEPASYLLDIPGVYEEVSEYYNNEVLSRWEAEQEENRQAVQNVDCYLAVKEV